MSQVVRWTCLNPGTEVVFAPRVEVGARVVFGPRCRRVSIGFGTWLGDDLYVDAPEVTIGEYCKVHRGCLLYGYSPLCIGHNCWIGQSTIIDSIGGAYIGNNVGIGAHSQLWSHIKFGDTLAGCRWNSVRRLVIEDDVWFVGHCVVGPITAHRRAMALAGSVVTKDMAENHVYAGVPAQDVTEKLGPQFAPVSDEERRRRFLELYAEFLRISGLRQDEFPIEVVDSVTACSGGERVTVFSPTERSYLPVRTGAEYRFMRFLLYDRAKFVPVVSRRKGDEEGQC